MSESFTNDNSACMRVLQTMIPHVRGFYLPQFCSSLLSTQSLIPSQKEPDFMHCLPFGHWTLSPIHLFLSVDDIDIECSGYICQTMTIVIQKLYDKCYWEDFNLGQGLSIQTVYISLLKTLNITIQTDICSPARGAPALQLKLH